MSKLQKGGIHTGVACL